MSDAVTIRPRTVRHVSIDSGQPYAVFRAAYEAAVPAFDRLEAEGVVRSGPDWSGTIALSDATAGQGLVNVFTFDPSPLLKLNGSTRQGVTYLAANIVRAERGFRADPGSLLYIPLRIMISETGHGTGQISFDLPADQMAVFDDPGLDAVGAGSGKTLARLLRHLGLPVPAELHGPPTDPAILAARSHDLPDPLTGRDLASNGKVTKARPGTGQTARRRSTETRNDLTHNRPRARPRHRRDSSQRLPAPARPLPGRHAPGPAR